MKAVLVMEMPESCLECPLEIGVEDTSGSKWKGNICRGCGKRNADRSRKPDWCPLVPERKQNACSHGFAAGWNACLDAIDKR